MAIENWQAQLSRRVLLFGGLVLLAVAWYAAHHQNWRLLLLLALAAAAFLVGSLLGFVFTSYADETNSIGKVKDWLVGAFAGLTVVEFNRVLHAVEIFAYRASPHDFALVFADAVFFTGLGFYFMFFNRELILNVWLTEKRSERLLLESTRAVALVTIHLNTALPTTILLGAADAETLIRDNPAGAADLKKQLTSDEVDSFLSQSDDAVKAGRPLDWDALSKVANLQYYRAYFAEAGAKPQVWEVALTWIGRALILYPEHLDLTMKRADVLANMARYREAVTILESIADAPDSPYYVEQWLGFYLLYLPGREDEAIRRNQSYLSHFPESNEALRNLACAYAQRACLQAKQKGTALDVNSADYKTAIEKLQEVVKSNPKYLTTIQQKWAAADGSYSCFSQDPGYLAATQAGTAIPTGNASPVPSGSSGQSVSTQNTAGS